MNSNVGHRLGLKTMIAEKTELVERMLSAAMAQTEELIGLLTRSQSSGDHIPDKVLEQEVESGKRQVQVLRELLTTSNEQSVH